MHSKQIPRLISAAQNRAVLNFLFTEHRLSEFGDLERANARAIVRIAVLREPDHSVVPYDYSPGGTGDSIVTVDDRVQCVWAPRAKNVLRMKERELIVLWRRVTRKHPPPALEKEHRRIGPQSFKDVSCERPFVRETICLIQPYRSRLNALRNHVELAVDAKHIRIRKMKRLPQNYFPVSPTQPVVARRPPDLAFLGFG